MVLDTGHKLLQAGHFATSEVAARVQELETAMDHLRAEVAQRRLLLRQAQEAQEFLMKVRGCWRNRRLHSLCEAPQSQTPGGARLYILDLQAPKTSLL